MPAPPQDLSKALVDSLSLSRIRTRTDALETLSLLVLLGADHLAPKLALQLCDGLVACLELEREMYTKPLGGHTAAGLLEHRLQTASSALRAIVLAPRLLRPKRLVGLLGQIELVYFESGGELPRPVVPTARNLADTVQRVLQRQFVKDRLDELQWTATFRFLLRAVRLHMLLAAGSPNHDYRQVGGLCVALCELTNACSQVSVQPLPLHAADMHGVANYTHLLQLVVDVWASRGDRTVDTHLAMLLLQLVNRLCIETQTCASHSASFARLVRTGFELVCHAFDSNTFNSFDNLKKQVVVFMSLDPLQYVTSELNMPPQGSILDDESIHSDDEREDHKRRRGNDGTCVEADVRPLDYFTSDGFLYTYAVLLGQVVSTVCHDTANHVADSSVGFALVPPTATSWFRSRTLYLKPLASQNTPTHPCSSATVAGVALALRHSGLVRPWMLHRAAVLWLLRFFELGRAQILARRQRLPRKPRLHDAVVDSLHASALPLEFFHILQQQPQYSKNGELQRGVLMLVAFYCEVCQPEGNSGAGEHRVQPPTTPNTTTMDEFTFTQTITPEILLTNVLQGFDTPGSQFAGLVACRALLPCTKGPTSRWGQALKLAVQLVKDPQALAAACAVAVAVLQHQEYTPDKPAVALLELVMELAEVNGPLEFSNHAFVFWCMVHQVGKSPAIERVAALQVVRWFTARWRVAERTWPRNTALFMAWMCGVYACEFRLDDEHHFRGSDCEEMAVYEQQLEVRGFFLRQETPVETEAAGRVFRPTPLLGRRLFVDAMVRLVCATERLDERDPDGALVARCRLAVVLTAVERALRPVDGMLAVANNLRQAAAAVVARCNEAVTGSAAVEWVAELNRADPADRDAVLEHVSRRRLVREAARWVGANAPDDDTAVVPSPLQLDECVGVLAPGEVLAFACATDGGDAAVEMLVSWDVLSGLCGLHVLCRHWERGGDVASPDQLVGWIGTHVLNHRLFHRSDLALCSQFRVLALVLRLTRPPKGMAEITRWWTESELAPATAASTCRYMQWMTSGGPVPESLWPMFGTATGWMQVWLVDHGLAQAFATSTPPEQQALYTSCYASFEDPQQLEEHAAVYTLLFAKLAGTLDLIRQHCVFNILECARLPWMLPYVPAALQLMCHEVGVPLPRDLFRRMRHDLLSVWWRYNRPWRQFPHDTVGYDTFQLFVADNYCDMAGLSVGVEGSEPLMATVGELAQALHQLPLDVLRDCVPVAVALAYGPQGVGEAVWERLGGDGAARGQALRIVLEMVGRVDCGNVDSLNKALQTKAPVLSLADAPMLFCLPHLLMEVGECRHAVGQVLARLCDGVFWDTRSVWFVVRRLFVLLLRLLSGTQRLLHLRRLVFVMETVPAALVGSDAFVRLVVPSVGPLLRQELTATEAAAVLVHVLLRASHGWQNQPPEAYMPVVVTLASVVAGEQRPGPVSRWLRQFVDDLRHRCSAHLLFPLVEAAVAVVAGDEYPLGEEDAKRFLTGNMADLDGGQALVQLLASVFRGSSAPSVEPSDAPVVARLLAIDSVLPTCPFGLWRARFLGHSYGRVQLPTEIVTPPQYPLSRLAVPLATNSAVLARVFDKILAELPGAGVEHAACIESVIGVVVWQQQQNHQLVKRDVDLSSFESFGHLSPLEFHQCVLANSEGDTSGLAHTQTLEQEVALLPAHAAASPLDTWLTRLALALLNGLAKEHPLAPVVLVYAVRQPLFAQHALGDLASCFVHAGGSRQAVVGMVQGLVAVDTAAATELALDVVLAVRAGALADGVARPLFAAALALLDLAPVFRSANRHGMAKAALMLFEEHHAGNGLWQSDVETLASIYALIEEPDLQYGLPAKPLMAHAIDTVNHAGSGWLSILANSAVLDGALSTGGNGTTRATAHLVESMLHSGHVGLARAVGSAGVDAASDAQYSWAWRLAQWDPAVPATVRLVNQAVYKALRLAHDYASSPQAVCRDVLLEVAVLRSMLPSTHEWIKALGCVLGVERVFGGDRSLVTTVPCVSFDEWDPLMLSRYRAWEQQAVGDPGASFAAVHELVHYGAEARSAGAHQKAWNSAVLVEELVGVRGGGGELQEWLARLAQFEAASTLWDQGISSTPVAMLQAMRKQPEPTCNLPYAAPLLVRLPAMVDATLVQWTHELKQATPELILDDYVGAIARSDGGQFDASVYHKVARFCHAQLKDPVQAARLAEHRALVEKEAAEMAQVHAHAKSRKFSSEEKRQLRRHYTKVQLRHKLYKETVGHLQKATDRFMRRAFEFYTKAVCAGGDDKDADALCGLWLEHSLYCTANPDIGEGMLAVPSHRLVRWAAQLTLRLEDTLLAFQVLLQAVVVQMARQHPHHVLYLLELLRLHRAFTYEDPLGPAALRARAADKVWRVLAEDVVFAQRVLEPLKQMALHCVALALHELTGRTPIALATVGGGRWWLRDAGSLGVVLPTTRVEVRAGGDYAQHVPTVVLVDPVVLVAASGISMPKVATFTLSDGLRPRMLLKGGADDLRQDAIMEQVFEHVNRLLLEDSETRTRRLRVRTYKVVPLGPKAGVLEFVAHSLALGDVVRPLHEQHGDTVLFNTARQMMKEVQLRLPGERLLAYRRVCAGVRPQLRHWFFQQFPLPDEWFRLRVVYTRGVACTLIVGHVLGLGDRHNNNVLLDTRTGEPVHIDLGVAFDQGKLLPVPETVPFRLTRDVVDGLGVTGTQGAFRKDCEHTLAVLRRHRERILSVLDILRWDPLYLWTLSPLKRQMMQPEGTEEAEAEADVDPALAEVAGRTRLLRSMLGSVLRPVLRQSLVAFLQPARAPEDDALVAGRAVAGVRDKLDSLLHVEAAVRELIQQAVAPENLLVIFCGWCPFY